MRANNTVMAAILGAAFCLPMQMDGQGAKSAGTSVADFAWLTGTWEGHMAGATVLAEATYSAPRAGVITGMMRLTDRGKLLMIEMIVLTDSPAGPELRFRHFNAQLDALEPVFKQNFRLVKHEADRDEFDNLVPYDKAVASTEARNAVYTRHGADEFVGHSDIIDDKGKPDVIELTWRRK